MMQRVILTAVQDVKADTRPPSLPSTSCATCTCDVTALPSAERARRRFSKQRSGAPRPVFIFSAVTSPLEFSEPVLVFRVNKDFKFQKVPTGDFNIFYNIVFN